MSNLPRPIPVSPTIPESSSACSREEQSLARAFASFTEAASSLERSYVQLQQEVGHLRYELQQTNRDLARSLEENHRIRQHLNRILEGLPCGVLVVEAGGQISTANPVAQHLLGVWRPEGLPETVLELLARTPAQGSEFEYRSAGGQAEWITVQRAQLGAQDGGSSIFILQNVTSLKRLQQEHELLRRRQALAEMSALLAHEIRNPLGGMELFAGLLAESATTGEQGEWIAHLQAGLRTLAATVNNVLHFHSEPPPQLAPTDAGRLLDWLGEFLRPLAERAHVTIRLRHDLEGTEFAADRHRLEQVLLNLGLNALSVMPEGGELTVSGQALETTIRMEISDTGPGIDPEYREQIFQPGFTTRAGSPGLGLAVCRKIVEQHGGVIRLAAPQPPGATFILEFRRAR
jgi:two-component system sensor histidine kinase FlrB